MPRTIGEQKQFATYFAGYTGLSLPVVEAWLLNEQPPGSPSKPGSNNWLNIGYTDAGPNSEYAPIASGKPQAAAKASAEWLKRNQPSILRSVGKSQAEQASAIINSGWASSHYGYDIHKFLSVVSGAQNTSFFSEIPRALEGPFGPGTKAEKELNEFGEKVNPLTNPVNPIKPVEEGLNAAKSASEFASLLSQPKTWVRLGEGIIGTIIILAALKTLSNKYGASRVVIAQTNQGTIYARKGVKYQKKRSAAKAAAAQAAKKAAETA